MNDEEEVWRKFLDFIDQYPTEPIYHYGSYEFRAIKMLSKRYETESKSLIDRLVNVNKQIYGQMYFPTYSNQLKDIARHLGFAWTSANASGLTSLVWRHHWDIHQDGEYKTKLLKYNEEDCHALKRIVDKVVEITESVNELSEVDFVDDLLKETSGIRNEVHS